MARQHGKLIVTGASGHFGRAAAAALLARVPARDLILVSRSPDRLSPLAERGVAVRYGDFDEPESLGPAFAGGDRMLLISGTRVGQRVPQHANAVSAAAAAGTTHVVYTSFVGAVPENPSLAVADHCGTEALLRECGLAWTAMRNSHYADYILAAAPNALKTGIWLGSAGNGRVAHVTRSDCVACAVEVMTGSGHENTVYEITGPELLTIPEVAAIVSKVTGRPIEYTLTDDDGMYAFFDSLGVPRRPVDDQVVGGIPWCSDDIVSFERSIREGHFAILSKDFERLTGRRPRTLREFALEHRAELLAAADA